MKIQVYYLFSATAFITSLPHQVSEIQRPASDRLQLPDSHSPGAGGGSCLHLCVHGRGPGAQEGLSSSGIRRRKGHHQLEWWRWAGEASEQWQRCNQNVWWVPDLTEILNLRIKDANTRSLKACFSPICILITLPVLPWTSQENVVLYPDVSSVHTI